MADSHLNLHHIQVTATDWLRGDRTRLFAVGAGVALVVCLVFMLIPQSLMSVIMAVTAAVISGTFALLAVVTWFAERKGMTDGADLWDTDTDDTVQPDEVLDGFAGFRTDAEYRQGL